MGTNRTGAALALMAPGALAQVLIATIPAGAGPIDIGVNTVTNRIYVSNSSSGSVSVIDGWTNSVVATIPVGSKARALSVNPSTNRVFVRVCCPAQLVEINGITNTVAAAHSIPTSLSGDQAIGLDVEVNPVTNRVYLAEPGVTLAFDASSGTFMAPVPVPSYMLAVDETTNRVYATGEDLNGARLSVIDGLTHTIGDIDIQSSNLYLVDSGLAVNPTTGLVYAHDWPTANLASIDPASRDINTLFVPAFSELTPVGVDPTRNRIYMPAPAIGLLAMNGTTLSTVTVANPAASAGSIDLGVNPGAGRIYVARRTQDGSGYVDVYEESAELLPVSLTRASTLAPPCAGPGAVPDCPYYRVTLAATVANNGGAAASAVRVQFAYSTDGSTFIAIGGPETISTLPYGSSATVTKTWMRAQPGAVCIRVTVDPQDTVVEPDNANNVAVFTISIP